MPRIAGLNCLVVLLSLLLTGSPHADGQQEPPSAPEAAPAQDAPTDAPAEPPAMTGDAVVDLNEGLRLFLTEDYAGARAILEDLRSRDPQNTACLYFLGLIYLEDGLGLARMQGRGAEARAAFERARNMLEAVSRSEDASLIPVESAVDLGIAQLASDDPNKPSEETRTLSARAAETLERYVSETEIGKTDRYGHFFLGVARYRLSARRPGAELERAASAFDEALRLAEVEQKAGELKPEDFAKFDNSILYYKALLDLSSRRLKPGLDKLRLVSDRARETQTQLAANADELIPSVEEEMKRSVEPGITLPSPVGPLRFEGSLTIGNVYDSNVILLGRDTALPRGIVKKGDYRLGLEASFDVSRVMTRDREGIVGESLTLGVGGTTFNFWQPSIGEFDINDYSGRAYVNWEPVRDLFVGLLYDYRYTMLGHDPFISSNRLTTVVTKQWRAPGDPDGDVRARSEAFYSYDYRDYKDVLSDVRFDRDGRYQSIGVNQSFALWKARDLWPNYYSAKAPGGGARDFADGDRWAEVRIGYQYRDERTHGDEFDLYGHSLLAGAAIPLPWRLLFDFGLDLTWDNYTHPSLLDYERKERFDLIQTYRFGLTRTIIGRGEYAPMPSLDIKVRGNIDLQYQDSNIWNRLGEDVYEFNRFIYGITLQIRF